MSGLSAVANTRCRAKSREGTIASVHMNVLCAVATSVHMNVLYAAATGQRIWRAATSCYRVSKLGLNHNVMVFNIMNFILMLRC